MISMCILCGKRILTQWHDNGIVRRMQNPRKMYVRLWWWLIGTGTLLVLAGAAALYARFVEPNWVEVTHSVVRVPVKLEREIKVAHLSDLHIQEFGVRERMILETLAQEKPDVIVITGDWISPEGTPQVRREFFRQLHAPLGVYAVRGNWDQDIGWVKTEHGFAGTEVQLLMNKEVLLPNGWSVLGIDDFTPEWSPEQEIPLSRQPDTCIALFHEPGIWDRMSSRCAVTFAGHTHAGQVRFPGVHPFWLPPGSGSYVEGWYEKGKTKMYVSRGIGTSRYSIRFLCRPELALVTISSSS